MSKFNFVICKFAAFWGTVLLTSSLIITACGKSEKIDTDGQDDIKEEKDAGGKLNAEMKEIAVDSSWYDDRVFSYGNKINEGYWSLTDEKHFEPVNQKREEDGMTIDAYRSGEDNDIYYDFKSNKGNASYEVHFYPFKMSKKFSAGEELSPEIRITRLDQDNNAPGNIKGKLYFAEIDSGDDEFGEKVSVREYFERDLRSVSRARILMDDFTNESSGWDWRDGENDENTYFSPVCNFPSMVKDGDKIWLVLEFSDTGEGSTKFRDVWEYSWTSGKNPDIEDKPDIEMFPDGEPDEDSPEWIKYEYAGHWDIEDVRYIGPVNPTDEKDGVKVKVERKGVDGQDIFYSFSGGSSDFQMIIPAKRFRKLIGSIHSMDSQFLDILAYISSDDEDLPGNITISVAFADVDYEKGKYGALVSPVSYPMEKGWPREAVETFSPLPHGDGMSYLKSNELGGGPGRALMSPSDFTFPEGKKDGDKLNLVLGVMDSVSGECRCYNIYEYNWVEGPDVVWVYNEPMTY